VWNRAFWQPAPDADLEHDDEDDWSHGPLHGGGAVANSGGTLMTTMWAKVATKQRLPLAMGLPTVLLVIFSVGLTMLAGPLFGITDRAAAELLERTPYITAVLGGSP
jgi:multicomponent Na+:H+ antiporter subunit D